MSSLLSVSLFKFITWDKAQLVGLGIPLRFIAKPSYARHCANPNVVRHSFRTIMNYEQLNKDDKIKSVVRHLADKFGEDKFKIMDHWDGDLNAIGLVDNEEKHLVYISAYGDNDYFVSLENSKTTDDYPYEPAGDFNNINIQELEKVFARHSGL